MSKNDKRKTPADYTTAHDLAIRAANRATFEDLECAAAHQTRMVAKQDLEIATRHEIPRARAAFEAANVRWNRLTAEVFDRVMAERGFPQKWDEEAA